MMSPLNMSLAKGKMKSKLAAAYFPSVDEGGVYGFRGSSIDLVLFLSMIFSLVFIYFRIRDLRVCQMIFF